MHVIPNSLRLRSFAAVRLALTVAMACHAPAAADNAATGDPPPRTLIEHLRSAVAPVFRPDHSLLRLPLGCRCRCPCGSS